MPARNTAADFWNRVNKSSEPDGCWIWTGFLDRGYGHFTINGRRFGAHRWAYEQIVGPIPGGLELDHLCRTPSCVNPAHLEPVTSGTNKRRANTFYKQPGQKWYPRSECSRGHDLTGANLLIVPSRPTRRRCRICEVADTLARRQRRRERAAS